MSLETLALALNVGGQIYAGQAASTEARSEQAMAKYNAAVLEQQARATEARTQLEQRRQAEAAARGMSTMAAEIGASGVVASEGTPLLVQAKQASEYELENLMIGYKGQEEVSQLKSKAALEKMQAKLYGQKAQRLAMGGYMKAGSTLLTGFNDMGLFDRITDYNPSMYSGEHQV